MGEQRDALGRGGRQQEGGEDARRSCASSAPEPTTFTGYEQLETHTVVSGVREDGRAHLVKLAESPFYAEGGGQVSDAGSVACEERRLRAARRRRRARRRRPGAARRGHARDARAGRARRRARRPRRAPRDRGQPHRDAPAARRAALASRRPRAPGRLVRRAGQAALRLHPHRAPQRRGAPRRRGRRQRDDPRQPAGAADHDDARRGAQPRRDGAVRREVRRRRADGRDRRRLAARASCAAARTCARPPRSG